MGARDVHLRRRRLTQRLGQFRDPPEQPEPPELASALQFMDEINVLGFATCAGTSARSARCW